MAYKKSKESKSVTDAKKRLSGMKVIDTNQGSMVEYGDAVKNPCNSALLASKITDYDTTQNKLNMKLSEVDELQNEEKALEKEIQSLSTRALKGAISKFGEDASEIEQLGGKRKSERKKPERKKK